MIFSGNWNFLRKSTGNSTKISVLRIFFEKFGENTEKI